MTRKQTISLDNKTISFWLILIGIYYYLDQKFVIINYNWFIKICVISLMLLVIIWWRFLKQYNKLILIRSIITWFCAIVLVLRILLLVVLLYSSESKNQQIETYTCEVVGFKRIYNQATFRFNNEKFTKLGSIAGDFDKKERLFFKNYNLIISLVPVQNEIYYIKHMEMFRKKTSVRKHTIDRE
jgi:magnesium-transporting ATPase (P-type)